MNVRFIHHSSFFVETPSAQFLFDYFQGALPSPDPAKTFYILASHSHHDHYDRIIYSLGEGHPDVRYILSTDVPEGDIPEGFKRPVSFVSPYEEYRDEKLTVNTLRSNDKGVAFVCEIDGLHFYHGGDLNNWCWDDGEVAKEDERIYHEELGRIEGREFDAAFIPLDSRLKDYHLGIENFFQHAKAKAVFPMHLWEKFSLIDDFLKLPSTAPYRERIQKITGDGVSFNDI